MSMGLHISRIRKRFLDSIGITEDAVEEVGGVLSSLKDQDGIHAESTLIRGSEIIDDFPGEKDLLNQLESYRDISEVQINQRGDYFIRIYTLNDLKRLLQDVKNKNVKLYYETKKEFNKEGISGERQLIIERLEDLVNCSCSDKYYYTTHWS